MRKHIGIWLLAATPCAIGQTGPHDGEWTAHFRAGEQARQARVVIKGQGGHLADAVPTAGRGHLLQARSAARSAQHHAAGDQLRGTGLARALADCVDGNPVTLKRVDDKTLEGPLSDGRPVKLVR